MNNISDNSGCGYIILLILAISHIANIVKLFNLT